MTLKEALAIIHAEDDAIGAAAGMNVKEAANVIAAFCVYKQNPRDYGLALIEAVMNWLAATGRAEGGEVLR